MMKRHRQLAFILMLAILASGCDQNRIREAAKASDRIATLVGSTIDLKRTLAASGQISQAEELALTQHLFMVNDATKVFNNRARAITEDTPGTRLELAEAFNAVTQAVNLFANQSIFPIGNPEAKAKLLAILNSINTSIQIIDSALKG